MVHEEVEMMILDNPADPENLSGAYGESSSEDSPEDWDCSV